MPSTGASDKALVACQFMSPAVTEPTTVSLVTPFCCQRTLTFTTPQVPLVRRAKKRKVGCSMPTQKAGETTRPGALRASDLASGAPGTLDHSVPGWDDPFVSDPPPP